MLVHNPLDVGHVRRREPGVSFLWNLLWWQDSRISFWDAYGRMRVGSVMWATSCPAKQLGKDTAGKFRNVLVGIWLCLEYLLSWDLEKLSQLLHYRWQGWERGEWEVHWNYRRQQVEVISVGNSLTVHCFSFSSPGERKHGWRGLLFWKELGISPALSKPVHILQDLIL